MKDGKARMFKKTQLKLTHRTIADDKGPLQDQPGKDGPDAVHQGVTDT